MNPSKVSGPFSIPTTLLKLLGRCLSKPLEILYNCSFSTGVVPNNFKLARVIPVFKKGSRTCSSNYRPISLLSIFNRLLEKLMYKRLISYIEKENIFYEGQFGFRSNHSTVQAGILIIDKIQKAIEKGLYSCGIFLDLSKAFDTVNHEILIKKLDHYGIRGVAKNWFVSYLNCRRQFVSIGSTKSNEHSIPCGVPQGSVLGPLLFLLYVNDLPRVTSVFDCHLFADDTNLFYANEDLLELESIININLPKINTWLACNKLSLNIDKTNFVIFHPPQKRIRHKVNLFINHKTISQATSVSYLGIHIDSNLNWKSQVTHIAKKIKRGIGVLCKIRHFVTTQVIIQLYYSLIYPHLTYGLPVWGNTYASTLNPLVILQKRVVRIITFSKYDEHSSPLFKQLDILKITDLLSLHNALLMYDFHYCMLPPPFDNFFKPVKNVHNYNTRLASRNTYYLYQPRTNYGKFSLRSQGPKTWNLIEDSLKKLSKSSFKKAIKSNIVNTY